MPGILGAFWQVDSPRERDLGFFFGERRQLERVRAVSTDEAVERPDLWSTTGGVSLESEPVRRAERGPSSGDVRVSDVRPSKSRDRSWTFERRRNSAEWTFCRRRDKLRSTSGLRTCLKDLKIECWRVGRRAMSGVAEQPPWRCRVSSRQKKSRSSVEQVAAAQCATAKQERVCGQGKSQPRWCCFSFDRHSGFLQSGSLVQSIELLDQLRSLSQAHTTPVSANPPEPSLSLFSSSPRRLHRSQQPSACQPVRHRTTISSSRIQRITSSTDDQRRWRERLASSAQSRPTCVAARAPARSRSRFARRSTRNS